MNCPVDNTELRISERQGIEIDYCPKCRGVWLDRGELDKLIERSVQAGPGPTQGLPSRERDRFDDDYSSSRSYDHERKKKRRSFLDDIFDFD